MKLKPEKFVPLLRKRARGLRVFGLALLASTSLAFAGMAACQAGFMNFPTSFWQSSGGGGGGTYVTSVTYYTVSIATSAASGTTTIPSVDTTKSFVVFNGSSISSGEGTNSRAISRVELTNATTLTAYRNTASSGSAITVRCAVVVCTSSLVSNIQQGTVSISASTSGTATITSVTTSRSAVFWLGHTVSTAGGSAPGHISGVTLTNSTTVTANCGTSKTMTVGYVVVEFQAAAITSVQQFSPTYTTSNTTDTQAITSVTTSRSIIAFGGQKVGNTVAQAPGLYYLNISSSTNVNLIRGQTDTTTRTAYFTVIEFASAVVNGSVQRGAINVSSGANTATLSPSMSTTRTLVSYLGQSNTSAGQSEDATLCYAAQTNATTVTAGRTTTGDGATVNVGWDAIEFT